MCAAERYTLMLHLCLLGFQCSNRRFSRRASAQQAVGIVPCRQHQNSGLRCRMELLLSTLRLDEIGSTLGALLSQGFQALDACDRQNTALLFAYSVACLLGFLCHLLECQRDCLVLVGVEQHAQDVL